MAGMFMLPRYLIHHQQALGDPAQEALWIDREAKLRRMIVTPSILMVWLLGALLAVNIGLFDGQAGLGWLHAKLVLVFILRSEEHTSELQSLMRISYAVFCLKKKKKKIK